MNWDLIGFDWNRVRALLVTAETGSYSAAAAALRLSQPTVGRQIAALEAELDVTLVEREGRGITLTPTGLALVEHARRMGAAAHDLALVASGRSDSLEGVVTLTASDSVCVYLLAPLFAEVRRRYPGILLDVVATTRAADLRHREADIAIRNYRPEDPELVASRLPDETGGMYATPGYLDSVGRPGLHDDLSRVSFIGFNRDRDFVTGMGHLGVVFDAAQVVLASENHLFQWEMACRGLGVAVNMRCIGDADPRVEPAFPELAPIPVPMWLVSHRAVRTSRRVRAVYDLVAEFFRARAPGGAARAAPATT